MNSGWVSRPGLARRARCRPLRRRVVDERMRCSVAFVRSRLSSRGLDAARAADGARRGEELVVGRDAPPGRPAARRGLAVERLAEQHHGGRGLRPTARSSSQAWPPPGCSPSSRKRASNRATLDAMRTSHASARFMPAPTAGAVHRGDRRQRQRPTRQEAFVDRRREPPALASSRAAPRWSTSAPEQNALRLAGDDDAPTSSSARARRRRRRSRRPARGSSRCAARVVERDQRDAVVADLVADLGHDCLVAARPRASGGRSSRPRARSGTTGRPSPTVLAQAAGRGEALHRAPRSCTGSGSPPA